MNFDEMKQAVFDAQRTLAKSDQVVGEISRMVMGRLKVSGISSYILAALKRELRDFNIHTHTWKK